MSKRAYLRDNNYLRSYLRNRFRNYLPALLIGLLSYLAFWQVNLHINAEQLQTRTQQDAWLEPQSASQSKGKPMQVAISINAWQIEYAPIEAMLWETPIGDVYPIPPSPATLNILERVYNALHQSEASYAPSRLLFLVRKSYPGDLGEQLADLLECYLPYQRDYLNSVRQINAATGEQKAIKIKRMLNSLSAKQSSCFGEADARSLFKNKNASFEFFMGSELVHLETNLSFEERSRRLDEVREQYAASLLE